LSQVNLEDREMVNGQLTLGPGTLYFLGPNLTLRNYALVLRVTARSLVIPQARFIDCTLDVRKELLNFRWDHALLQGCRFTGRLVGNDFGRWSDLPPEKQGGITDCDFTGAHLDGCRFIGCDVSTLQLPSWPYFTILDPVRRWRELRALPWPGDIGPIKIESFADAPSETAAVTYSALELAKRRGTTPEAIRAVLEQMEGVKY
jgi:hypothetical protein